MPPVIPPAPGPDDQYFWDGVAERKLMLRRCAQCKELQHPPVPMCGNCHSLEWEVQEASGKGTVYTYIVSKHPSEPDAEPRVVALIELEEGIRLISNLQNVALDEIANDMPVTVSFAEFDGDVVLPQFVPAGKA